MRTCDHLLLAPQLTNATADGDDNLNILVIDILGST